MAHAARRPDEEVCGLLLGAPGRVLAVRPAANVAAERGRRFELDPAVLLAAHREARGGGHAVLGHYHSHPSGAAMPSARDAENATPGCLWMIVAGGRAALFETVRDAPIHRRFRAVPLECR